MRARVGNILAITALLLVAAGISVLLYLGLQLALASKNRADFAEARNRFVVEANTLRSAFSTAAGAGDYSGLAANADKRFLAAEAACQAMEDAAHGLDGEWKDIAGRSAAIARETISNERQMLASARRDDRSIYNWLVDKNNDLGDQLNSLNCRWDSL